MSRRRIGTMLAGMMILLSMGAAACSVAAPATTVPEVVARDIKVYESPT